MFRGLMGWLLVVIVIVIVLVGILAGGAEYANVLENKF